MTQDINLSSIFAEVTKVLEVNQRELDNADEYNHNHGSNMVNTFSLLQKAVESVKDQPVADQLGYASKNLRSQSTSGSAQLYADGLAQASQDFVGKELNAGTAGTLINAMMGMGETSERGGGDFLSALLGNLTKPKEEEAPAPSQPEDLLSSLVNSLAGQKPPATTQQTPASQSGSDLLGSILGGLTGKQEEPEQKPSGGGLGDIISGLLGGQSSSSQSQSDGFDAKDLISMGLAYYAAKQGGQSNLQAIMQALSSSSPFGKRNDQTQSGALVVNTILNMLGSR